MSGNPKENLKTPLGIVAGKGPLPVAVAEAARKEGRKVFIVGVPNESERGIEAYPHAWIPLGKLGATVSALKKAGCRDLVMIGPLARPELSALRLDWGGLKFLPRFLKLLRNGDDALLRGFVDYFEKEHGFCVVPAEGVLTDLRAPAGVWTKVRPDAADEADIARGKELLAAIGPFDMGQGTVICRNVVLSIEGPEGTDAMLARVAALPSSLRGKKGARAGVLVKLPKPEQERRVDLPTIGVMTVENAAAAGLAGIAVEAGGALVVDMRALVARADELGLYILALEAAA
ncbi:LpxI family protein [Tepidicaulis sp.]|uniref:LpxI family protein n=1 Tax=Tepidicaulis sp. TaxID=1920809 RepID=UPI003B5C8C0D